MSDKLYGLPYIYIRLYPSIIPLIVANLFPFYGVLFLGWDLFTVMILFWLETSVLGFYTLLRIIVVANILSIIFVPFFLFHFGMFMLIHLLLLSKIFGESSLPTQGDLLSGEIPFAIAQAKLYWFVVFGFFLSHGFSFLSNFIGKREYLQMVNIGNLMTTPYKRMVIMHMTLIFGGFLILIFDRPLFGVILLLTIKLYTDIRAHIKEHAGAQKSQIN